MATERKKKFIIDVLYAAILIFITYFVLKYLIVWLMPFFIAFLVAIILQKPVKFLSEKVKIPRGISSFVCVLLILSAAFALITAVCYGLYSYIPSVIEWITSKAPVMKETFAKAGELLTHFANGFSDDVSTAISAIPSKAIDALVPKITGFLTSFATKIVMNMPSFIIASIITVVASCFMTKDYPKMTLFILKQVSEEKRNIIKKAKSLFVENILKMLRGYIFIMLITFTELFIGLSIIRVPNAALIAACTAVFDILPVLGSGGILITWAVIDLVLGNPLRALGLLVLYGIITVIRNIIEPKIIGKQVGLPPIITLISMFLGYYLFGGIGLIALPVGIIILVKLQENGLIKIFRNE